VDLVVLYWLPHVCHHQTEAPLHGLTQANKM